MRFSTEDLELIKVLFKEDKHLKLLRKIFLPTIDGTEEIGVLTDALLRYNESEPNETLIQKIKTDLLVLKHIEGQLAQLKSLAQGRLLTEEERKELATKNSSR